MNTKSIYVFAPANSMLDLSSSAIDIGVKRLTDLGFEVIFGKNVNKKHLYTAGTVKQRLQDIEDGLKINTVKIMMAVYGGHNTNQLLDKLDYDLIKRSKKIFVGYSDVTVLLNAIWAKSAVRCVHGPSFATFCDPNISEDVVNSFMQLIHGKSADYTAPSFAAADLWYLKKDLGPREIFPHPPWLALREGTAIGPVVGGNLDSLTALIGTTYLPSLAGPILLIETSLHEDPGRFDRQMTGLSHAGAFDQLKGLIIGQFSPNSLLAQKAVIKEIIDRVIGPRSFPIMINGSFSHVDPLLSLPIGGKIRLDAYSDKCKIKIIGPL